MMSRANQTIAVVGIAVVILGALFLAVSALRGANHMAWQDKMPPNIRSVAVFIEIYRDDYGLYPSSLEELIREETISANKKDLTNALNLLTGIWKCQCDYKPLSNGFVITVTKPGSLLSPKERMEKIYLQDTAQQSQPAQKNLQ